MRFHLVGLPMANTTAAYVAEAYSQKCLKFCKMMTRLGHEVILYGGDANEALCTEFVPCWTPYPPERYLDVDWTPTAPIWTVSNARVIEEMGKRLRLRDFILITAGRPQKAIADAFPNHMSVEWGIGYSGTFARFQVFESNAWRHAVMGQQLGAHFADGNDYHATIPNFFDPQDFPFSEGRGDYYLFVGRCQQRKGVQVAVDACQRLGARLVIAGHPGDFPIPALPNVEYVGPVGPQKRGELMAHALALFVPTRYLGPFEGVHIESMLCGVPVLTTDWGVFPETVRDYVNGFRCHTLAEYVEGARFCATITQAHRSHIRETATDHYGLDAVGLMYQKYFTRLQGLYAGGWYA